MKVAVGTSRARIDSSFAGLRIAIPARRNWFVILFLLAWLGGWVMGETSAIRMLASGKGEVGFMVFWLCGWTVGGAFAIGAWLWNVAGMEYISIRNGELAHRFAVGPVGWSREYALAHVTRLRAVPTPQAAFGQRWGNNPFVPNDGTICFDYGAKTIRMGSGLDEAEARQLVDQMTSRHHGLAALPA
ncbi:MAG: hypothetical protein ACREO8_03515 [Luteimonas sp.]